MEALKRLTVTFWETVRHGKLRLETETSWFVLASALDFAMTFIMLKHENPNFRFVESNPIARFFLDHWGINGLLAFKLGIVVFVVTLCQIIARHNPKSAKFVLYVGTAVVSAVVIYSMLLHRSHTQ